MVTSKESLGTRLSRARLGQEAAWLAATWCVLFVLVHLYWAWGGTVGFVAATGSSDLIRPTWFVIFGLWGVALVCLVGAGAALAAVQSWGRGMPQWMVRTVLWMGVIVLLLRALPTGVQDVLLVTGVLHPARPLDWSVVHWRLALWTPWFLIGATLFLLTAIAAGHRRRLISAA
ncbi:DUF3995 domain-containing protein [Streptantibioticus ferralitis]|uniref:DUF3995 domain-containing protein n=1 Tax=Streptantibioticus ferralitis TaxID=236510 RepID=A0ABT5Z8U5_9ACTN|nr:DUF3995 domain-containing protein [Streptantibioticus ferralitis]MDF2260240.1 DUF3995 domain-containing protein [Streptantibioticus ferralitis]